MSGNNHDEQEILEKIKDMPKNNLSINSKTRMLHSIKQHPHNKHRRTRSLSFVASLLLFPAIIFAMWQLLSTEGQTFHQALGFNIDLTPAEDHIESIGGMDHMPIIEIVPQELTGYYATDSLSTKDIDKKIEQLLNKDLSIKAYELNGVIRQDNYSFASFHYVDERDHLFIGTVPFHNREDRLLIDQIIATQVTDDGLRDLEDGYSPAVTLFIEDMYYFLGIGYSLDNNIESITVNNNERTFDYSIDGHVLMTVISQTNPELVEASNDDKPGYGFMQHLDTTFCLEDGQCYQRYFMNHPERPFPEE